MNLLQKFDELPDDVGDDGKRSPIIESYDWAQADELYKNDKYCFKKKTLTKFMKVEVS